MRYAIANSIANRLAALDRAGAIDVQGIAVERWHVDQWYVYVQGWDFTTRVDHPAQLAACIDRAAR